MENTWKGLIRPGLLATALAVGLPAAAWSADFRSIEANTECYQVSDTEVMVSVEVLAKGKGKAKPVEPSDLGPNVLRQIIVGIEQKTSGKGGDWIRAADAISSLDPVMDDEVPFETVVDLCPLDFESKAVALRAKGLVVFDPDGDGFDLDFNDDTCDPLRNLQAMLSNCP